MKSTKLTIYNYEEHDAHNAHHSIDTHNAIDAHNSIDAHTDQSDSSSTAVSDCINYAESQIEKYSPLIESALSKRHVRLFKKSMHQFMTNDEINALGQNSWKSVFDIYIKAFCWAAVSNQYTYSTPAFRKNLTYKVILKKCLILDLSYDDTLKVMKECGFLDDVEVDGGSIDNGSDDEERQQNTTHTAGTVGTAYTACTTAPRRELSDSQYYTQLKDIYYQQTHRADSLRFHLDTLKSLCPPEQYENIVKALS